MKTYSSAEKQEQSIVIECPLCGQAPFAAHFHVEDARFVRCKRCGIVYQNPQPVFTDLRERYRDEYFQYEFSNEENFFSLMLLGLKDIGYTDSFLKSWDSKTFCDIGCATGRLLEHVMGLGFNVAGVEVCPESAEYGIRRRGVPIHAGTLEEAAFPDASFSIIHFSHLIEHVPDPEAFLLEVKRILAPGGRVIITTPNIAGFQAQLFREKWRSAIRDHVFLFSKRTLGMLLNRVGFRVLQVKTWGGLAVGSAPKWLKRPIDRLAKKWGFGDVMMFLVEKGEDIFND